MGKVVVRWSAAVAWAVAGAGQAEQMLSGKYDHGWSQQDLVGNGYGPGRKRKVGI